MYGEKIDLKKWDISCNSNNYKDDVSWIVEDFDNQSQEGVALRIFEDEEGNRVDEIQLFLELKELKKLEPFTYETMTTDIYIENCLTKNNGTLVELK